MTAVYSSDQSRHNTRQPVRAQGPPVQLIHSGHTPRAGHVHTPRASPEKRAHSENGDRAQWRPSRPSRPLYSTNPTHNKKTSQKHQKQRSNSKHLPNNHKHKTELSKNRIMSSEVNSRSTSTNLVKGQLHLHGQMAQNSMQTVELHHRPIVKPHNTGHSSPESELTTSFDPMKDRHMWTMWRTAVTGRIVDEAMRLEQLKRENRLAVDGEEVGVYGKALIVPPLKRFIKFGEGSKEIAHDLMSRGQGSLLAPQFVYYGLPRVYVSKSAARSEARPNE